MLHHPSLYATTDGVAHGTGLKSRVSHARGDFIGFYTGRLIAHPICAPEATSRSFEIAGTGGHMILAETDDDVLGFVNEPPAGQASNLVAIPLHLELGNAVGYFVCVGELPADTEMWVHYGDLFERDYAVGEPGEEPEIIQTVADLVSAKTMRSQRHRFIAPRKRKSIRPQRTNE